MRTEECLSALPPESFFLTRYRSTPLPESVPCFHYRVIARRLAKEEEASTLAKLAYRLSKLNGGIPVVRLSGRTLVSFEELTLLDTGAKGKKIKFVEKAPLTYHTAAGKKALLRLVRGYIKTRAADKNFIVGVADFILSPRFRMTDNGGLMGLQTGVVFTVDLDPTNSLVLECDMRSKILRQTPLSQRLVEEEDFDPIGREVSSLKVAETLVVEKVLEQRVGEKDDRLGMSVLEYNKGNDRYDKDVDPDPNCPVIACRAVEGSKTYHYDSQLLFETLSLRAARKLDGQFASELADATRMDTAERERFCSYFVRQLAGEGELEWLTFNGHAEVVGRGNDYKAFNVALPRDNLVFHGKKKGSSIERGIIDYGLLGKLGKVKLGVLYPQTRAKGAETFTNNLVDGLTELCRGRGSFKTVFEGAYSPRNPFNIQAAVAELAASEADLALVLLPGRGSGSPYVLLKSELAKQRFPSQMIHLDTHLSRRELVNILVGVTSKLGRCENWQLGKLLWAPDLFIGVSSGRVDEERLAAVATAFDKNGTALDVTVEMFAQAGDKIGESRLLHLLEGALLAYRTVHGNLPTAVVVHRDGEFPERTYRRVWNHFRELGITMTLVALDIGLPPRVGRFSRDRREPPTPGTLILTGDESGMVITSSPRGNRGCPRPVAFRRVAGLVDIRAVGGHIFWLSRAHMGSITPPRLPVTVHFARKVIRMARDGLVPHGTMGKRMLFV